MLMSAFYPKQTFHFPLSYTRSAMPLRPWLFLDVRIMAPRTFRGAAISLSRP